MSKHKTRAPEQTFEEAKYLKRLVDDRVTVRIRLMDNEEVTGRIEFFDTGFLRLTRTSEPNLFIYKHDIKYLCESAE